ncbi:MAG: 16S rRNA (cytosine(1402)-N(4))-methyltransferase RsmH [Nitrospinae bacterium]|nr:16S rRNA (cytosine(1402)-N(4))-methyltransferase RsmH [Nitrospinota bacterium]
MGTSANGNGGHKPVLLEEVLSALAPKPGGLYLDCTLGGGGHAEAILDAAGRGSRLIGLDRDESALGRAGERLKRFGDGVELHHGRFERMKEFLAGREPDGIVIDLGVSSFMLDEADRGFSFRADAPLDMRMDRTESLTAREIVNTWSEADLVRIFFEYGEERFSRKIARRIVEARPVDTTLHLAQIIASAYPKGQHKINPATRVFMALRISVNGELEDLGEAMNGAVDALKTGGRLAVITFHSLEDRIVKRSFARMAAGCVCPPRLPVCVCDKKAQVKLLARRPISASDEEIAQNPRSRSAHLRVVEKEAA